MAQPTAARSRSLDAVALQLPEGRDWRARIAVASGLLRLSRTGALVLSAMVVGAVLRFANLGGIPPALNQDEANFAYDAYSLFLTGRDHNGHPFPLAGVENFGLWSPALLPFIAAPAVGLFGLHVEVIRGVTAAVGLVAIPLTHLLATALFKRASLGALAAWLVAVSPWHVHNSRYANLPSIVPTMLALTLLLFVWSVHRRSSRGIVATAIAAGLTADSYYSMKVYLPLLGLAAVVIYWESITRMSREALVYAVLLLVLIAGPSLYLTTFDPGGRARADQVSVFNNMETDGRLLLRQYLSYFSPRYLFIHGGGDPMYVPPGSGVWITGTWPFLLAGLIVLGWRVISSPADRRHVLFLLVALVLYPIPAFLTVPSPHALRSVHVIPLLAVITAVGAVALGDGVREIARRLVPTIAPRLVPAMVVVALLPTASELVDRHRYYFQEYPNEVLGEFQFGLEQALGFVIPRQSDYREIWVGDTNQGYIYVLFYSAWPPSDVHKDLRVRRAPPATNRTISIGPYRFGRPADLLQADLPILMSVPDPTGETAFLVRGGEVADRGSVLLVHRP